MATVDIPSFRFSGLYYAETLQDLLIWARANVPEISDEDPNEPFIQLLRAFALVGHQSNVLIDHVALESLLPTARLRESVRALLNLIGYTLKQPTPGLVDLVLKLSAALTAQTVFPKRMRFATRQTTSLPEILFETGASTVTVERTDQLLKAWEYDKSLDTYTDRTADLNADGGGFDPWAGNPADGDLLYFGHGGAFFDKFDLTTAVAGDLFALAADYVWEYHDGQLDDTTPSSVIDLGGAQLEFDLTSLLGTTSRAGADVKVRSRVTGKAETVVSTFAGGKNKATTTYLGQVAPSVTAADYVVGVLWKEPANIVETVVGSVRTVAFDLPETLKRKWQTVAVNAVTAYWFRLRVVDGAASVDSPQPSRIKIDVGRQYIKVTGTQGLTESDDPAGSSTGLKDQTFVTSKIDVIEGTAQAFIDEGGGDVEYTVVDDFLSSTSTDRHFTIGFDDEGRATVKFGDGTNGKIPPAGVDNVRLDFRHGAKEDGNVGADVVVVNRSGAARIASVTNPRAATGWKIADGGDATDLARVKIAGPASLRTLSRALTADDVDTLAQAFVAADGSSPVARAHPIEDGLGVKTIKLILVGAGGGAVPAEVLTEIDDHFNGVIATGKAGVLVLNTKATSSNHTSKTIAVTLAATGGDKAKIKAAITAYLSPLAKDTAGLFEHAFDGTVFKERLVAVAFNADPGKVKNVVLTVPAADVNLLAEELPAAGVVTVT